MNLIPFAVSGIGLGGIYALSSVGLVILYRASGTLNFAFGAFGGLAAFFAWQLARDGVPAPVSWLAGIAVSTGLAYAYGRIVAPRMAHRDRVVRAVATLGLALFLLGGMAWYWGVGIARRLTLPTDLSFVTLFGVRISDTRLIALGLALAMAGGVGLILARTRIGLGMRALASDRHISSAIGVSVNRIDAFAWLVNGAFAGIAGILLANLNRLDPALLTFLVIPAVASAILARLSSLPGAFAGGMVCGMIEALLTGVPAVSNFRSAGPFIAALLFLVVAGAGRGVGATEAPELASGESGGSSGFVRVAAIVATVAIVTGVIGAFAGGYWLSNFAQAYCYVLALMGCALLYGQLGLVSLCQLALVGAGGWVALRVYHWYHPPFLVTILAGGVGASVIGMIWGLPALRMRGLYLALVTLMLAGAFQVLISVTGFPVGGPGFLGQVGASGNARVMMARPVYAASDVGYFAFIGAVVLVAILLVEAHRRSKPGRAWALIRKSEQMAAASGVRVVFYKAWAFALSGFLAGVAGALLAGLFGQLDASSFAPTDSITIFIGTLLGGTGVWVGPFLGGILTRFIPALLTDWNVNNYVGLLFFGAALMHALTANPEGIGGAVSRLARRLVGRLPARRPEVVPTPSE
ncbi:MAG TPA: ABC transporter permease [Hyphomicrobiales bacterium]|nr:ABC transporter permease [Hyphomicrobiales bacterium]